MPTRSEQKLQHQDLYKLNLDCSCDESDSEGENESVSESEGNEESCDANVGVETPEGNRIIDVKILGAQISSNLVCGHCHHAVQLFEAETKGLASTFAFHCVNKHRNRQPAFSSSPQITVSNSVVNVVNRRAAFAMRCLGGDRSELETFCGVMDLPKSASESRFRAINKTIHKTSTSVQKNEYASCSKS